MSKVGVVKILQLANRNKNWNYKFGALDAKETNMGVLLFERITQALLLVTRALFCLNGIGIVLLLHIEMTCH